MAIENLGQWGLNGNFITLKLSNNHNNDVATTADDYDDNDRNGLDNNFIAFC